MIDWNRVPALREEVGAEDFDEVVELFLQEVDEEIETLTKTRDGLAEKLHFLKGSALSLGFSEFSSLCQSGETSLSADPMAQVDLPGIQAMYQSSRTASLTDLPAKFRS